MSGLADIREKAAAYKEAVVVSRNAAEDYRAALSEAARKEEDDMGSALCGNEGPWPPIPDELANTPLDELQPRKPYRVYDLAGKWLEGEFEGTSNLDANLLFRFGEFRIVISPASVMKAMRL